ncbi:TetR/AcrR family transcriptional regulator [Cohnella cholangitidis]|uniref:TetR/AcrR family transcriptional regulator n=1 Tax=Cohnella cholangitidis TaxID=2598458 RepID=A0A7G5BTI5_9BACL|nr:TetR/AcrR family transcriptional regulator [Cohnella cholangitidis]QMV40269.1 TetR/AcrR family transcriptional regulator [Cohnella cholangitidis]
MSPRTKEQNEEIRKQRSQEIMRAAIAVYAEKGYAASEIGEIAEKAGLARGLVYHYFKSKQSLFRELHDYMMDGTRKFTKSYFEQEGPALELFAEYARKVCKQVLEESAISRFYMRISLDVHYLYTPEEYTPFDWMKSFIEPMKQAVEKGIGQGSIRQGDANLMALQFWGAVSQGMSYLDRLQQELISQGMEENDSKDRLNHVLEQIVESALAVLRG